jgi:RNA polymerase sigma-70 factor (sigma-E family)
VINRIGGRPPGLRSSGAATAVVEVSGVHPPRAVTMSQGDNVATERAFEDLYRAERRRILAVVVLLTGDRAAAEDIVQDAFAAALRRWTTISAYDRPGDWVKRVAVNKAISRFRRGRNERVALARVAGWPAADGPDGRPGELADPLWAAVRRLPRRQAQVIALMYVDDLSAEQVAATLGCSVGAVKSHVHRAKRHLAVTVERETTR